MSLQPPASSQTPKAAWITVYQAVSLPEAQIVAGRLEYEGIPALVDYPVGSSAMGIGMIGSARITVLVHPTDFDRARDILETDAPTALPDTTDSITYDWTDDDEAFDDE